MAAGRGTARLAVLFVVILAITSVQSQISTSSVEVHQPGILQRIMTNYVDPIRDMDWRQMLRDFMGRVMNYVSPSVKEPKSGFQKRRLEVKQESSIPTLENTKRHLKSNFDDTIRNKKNRRIPLDNEESNTDTDQPLNLSKNNEKEEIPSKLTALTRASSALVSTETATISNNWRLRTNPNLSDSMIAHSWEYLSYLLLYMTISIVSALIPIIQPANIVEETGPLEPLEATGFAPPNFNVDFIDESGPNFQIRRNYQRPASRYTGRK